jgi:hypothetical protein
MKNPTNGFAARTPSIRDAAGYRYFQSNIT